MTNGGQLGCWPDRPPRGYRLQAVIRSLVSDGRVVLLDHADERMQERDIDMIDVLDVLGKGDIKGDVRPGKKDREWICKVVDAPRSPDNPREIGVVTIVLRAEELLIMTVEWEDMR